MLGSCVGKRVEVLVAASVEALKSLIVEPVSSCPLLTSRAVLWQERGRYIKAMLPRGRVTRLVRSPP